MSDPGYQDQPYEQDGKLWRMIRCIGCGVPIGFTPDEGLRSGVYCSTWCVWEYNVRGGPTSRLTPKETTRDAWYWLYQSGLTVHGIAGRYGIDNDFRVHKAVQSRRVDDELRAAGSQGVRVVVTSRRTTDGR